jgi:hypothetical protein
MSSRAGADPDGAARIVPLRPGSYTRDVGWRHRRRARRSKPTPCATKRCLERRARCGAARRAPTDARRGRRAPTLVARWLRWRRGAGIDMVCTRRTHPTLLGDPFVQQTCRGCCRRNRPAPTPASFIEPRFVELIEGVDVVDSGFGSTRVKCVDSQLAPGIGCDHAKVLTDGSGDRYG